MQIKNYKDFKELFASNVPLELKLHIVEAYISELIYKAWCRMTGGKFERNEESRENSCVLVAKTGFHPILTIIGATKSHSINALELEVYKRNCPGPTYPAISSTQFHHWWIKYVSNEKLTCTYCGKSYEIQPDDKKIIGKF